MYNYNINKSTQQNITRLCKLEFIPSDHVSAINILQDARLSIESIDLAELAITVPQSYTWYFGYFEKGNEEIETDTKQTDNGPLHTTEIAFFLPSDDPAHAQTLERINEYRFIVKYTDRSGNIKIVGSIENGCMLSYKFLNRKGNRGYQIKFSLENNTANAYLQA